jgi:ornithine decarboxylase
MQASFTFTGTPATYIASRGPDVPILFFDPAAVHTRFALFQSGFPGLVTYAVKANDTSDVIENLHMAGLSTFDVASPAEIARVRDLCPDATLHYNNPIRSIREIQMGVQAGVVSWSVDCISELEKLIEDAVMLLKRVAQAGYQAAMTFHVGTQCTDYSAWDHYITTCHDIAQRASVTLSRLNVGGGFPAHRDGAAPDLTAVFDQIATSVERTFGDQAPKLVCEPGRALVSECYQLLVRVKGRKANNILYLNDGIYGAMAEWRDIGPVKRLEIMRPSGEAVSDLVDAFTVFGPTCDSLDRLPGTVALPRTIQDGDYILISGMGAYSNVTCTPFNGYGVVQRVTIAP